MVRFPSQGGARLQAAKPLRCLPSRMVEWLQEENYRTYFLGTAEVFLALFISSFLMTLAQPNTQDPLQFRETKMFQ